MQEDSDEKDASRLILDELTTIMQESRDPIRAVQEVRQEEEGLDIPQSTASVAGHNYQALVGYCLEVNRLTGNIPETLRIAIKPKKHRIIRDYATINVMGGETQKPDVDLILYMDVEESPVVIISCKTSLRERAGQTYKWKLLMDLARCQCNHESDCPLSNYSLEYNRTRDIHVGLITADFYDERDSPQQRGMFEFFDFAFVSKPIEATRTVHALSAAPDYISALYGEWTNLQTSISDH